MKRLSCLQLIWAERSMLESGDQIPQLPLGGDDSASRVTVQLIRIKAAVAAGSHNSLASQHGISRRPEAWQRLRSAANLMPQLFRPCPGFPNLFRLRPHLETDNFVSPPESSSCPGACSEQRTGTYLGLRYFLVTEHTPAPTPAPGELPLNGTALRCPGLVFTYAEVTGAQGQIPQSS